MSKESFEKHLHKINDLTKLIKYENRNYTVLLKLEKVILNIGWVRIGGDYWGFP